MAEQQYKQVNGERVPLSASEQQEYEARISEYNSSLPSRLKQYLANYRYSIETGGLNGIQTDRETRANLVSARTLAKEDDNYTVKWKAANGAFVTLNAAQIIATADAVAAFVAKCFASEESVATAIDAGTHTTEAEVKTAFDTEMQS